MPDVEINDEIFVAGHNEARYFVLEVDGGTVTLQQFADEKRTGTRIYFERKINVPLGVVTVFGKNHKKPSTYKVVRT
jgi:hypothetical protein